MANKMVVGGLVAGGLMLGAAGLVIGAGIAKADTTPLGTKGDHSAVLYDDELDLRGIEGSTPQKAAALGAMICAKLDAGSTEADLVNAVARVKNATQSTANVVVWSAEWHFCPEHY